MGRGQGQGTGNVATRSSISARELELDKTYLLKMTASSEDYAERFTDHIKDPQPSLASSAQVAQLHNDWARASSEGTLTDIWSEGDAVVGRVQVRSDDDRRQAQACIYAARDMDFPVELAPDEPSGMASQAGKVAELHACLEMVYGSLPDHSIGEDADRFDAMLELTADSGLDLTLTADNETAQAITQLLWLGLSSDGLDEGQRTRLVASLALLGS